MIKEVTAKAATIEEAIEKAAQELNVEKSLISIEVLETPKRSLFGKTKEAVIKATLLIEEENELSTKADIKTSAGNPAGKAAAKPQAELTGANKEKLEKAIAYVKSILDNMGITDVKMSVSQDEESASISFEGENLAVLIGHHGETLDALQYLVSLATNRSDGNYYRIILDCGNYRVKREATLQGLATRIAEKVKKTTRSQTLEPMNPYERRIIHAVVSEISGVSSKSKGEEPNRRVIILSDAAPRRGGYQKGDHFDRNDRPSGGAKRGGYSNDRNSSKPYVHKPERTMEEILKDDFKDKESKEALYSKIEL